MICVDLMNIFAMFTELLLQSDSPRTDVYQGVAVSANRRSDSDSVSSTELHISRTHSLAICLPSDKRLGKLLYLPKKKPCGPKALTSQSAIVSGVVEQLCRSEAFICDPSMFHLITSTVLFSPLRGHCSWILRSAYFVDLSTC